MTGDSAIDDSYRVQPRASSDPSSDHGSALGLPQLSPRRLLPDW